MPPSQLKRLKASLREQGILGPQLSKKQKRQNAQNGVNREKRVSRNTALVGIREQFNPFEFRELSGKPKFEATTEHSAKKAIRKPGLQKSLEEEARREAYLAEQQRRRKVGGILDKRFGENDPGMAPEDKMLERFTREKQLRHKNNSAFDLEDEDIPGELTHMGQSLSLDGPILQDDFDEDGLELSDAEDHSSDEEGHTLKRRRQDLEVGDEEEEDLADQPERKKSKLEVMKEVIAKSKLHKYERQAAKDDDEELREELDKEMSGIHGLLRQLPSKRANAMVMEPGMNPERAALLNGMDKIKFDREYDMRMRQLARDQKSKPTEKSKNEEELAAERAQRLQELDSKRLRRMRGSPIDSDEEPEATVVHSQDPEEEDFGFGAGIKVRPSNVELGIEDEDDFLIDVDLIASNSELEETEDESLKSDVHENPSDDEDEEFINDILTVDDAKRPEFLTGANAASQDIEIPSGNGVNGNLAYKFTCPESHEDLVQITKDTNILDLPVVVQRIRALYHPKLKGENKAKLAKFSAALVDHISYLANSSHAPNFVVIETLIRHVHSLAKSFPIDVANAFRRHLKSMNDSRALSPTIGDLVLLTAVGVIFPTSDHFHQVVTPALLSMGRYLGLKVSQELYEYATGTYLCTLCLHYLRLSKRYVPEVMNFIQNTLCALSPLKLPKVTGNFPYHEPKHLVRIEACEASSKPGLNLLDCAPRIKTEQEQQYLKEALLDANIHLLSVAADTWIGKDAFIEVFHPTVSILEHLSSDRCRVKLSGSTQQAKYNRRPLELHHHRPLAIKTSIPKFEENFNPDRHYDPDKTRTESAKLKKEHKRERKGAIRELRKDAHILAVQSLKEKKERDAAYEKKYKRLIAEIQGEEGHEAKVYEREKAWRKKGKK